MAYMFEVYYKTPPDTKKEAAISERVSKLGGRPDYREEPDPDNDWESDEEVQTNTGAWDTVTLTYEFDHLEQAEEAAEFLRREGEHVEGPQDYGP
ncbi:MAG TPA: hypothetical protein DDY78_09950 [Planctomycetales bacterium]|jgi:hypothetical protein|nr:hypothetical protein [Planctomycetales bacterium]